jgi:uncharacterized protein YdaU (DUF1376 family)
VNYYRRYIGDYQRDTMHLSMPAHGAYTLLLDAYYASDGKLPAAADALAAICRATSKNERDVALQVADEFFPVNGDGKRHNKRADKELSVAIPAIEKMRIAGKKSARNRYGNG